MPLDTMTDLQWCGFGDAYVAWIHDIDNVILKFEYAYVSLKVTERTILSLKYLSIQNLPRRRSGKDVRFS